MFTLFKENIVNAEVPDKGGITSNINVWRDGLVKDIKVHLNISHPFVGDLMVKLASPSGKEVVLHNRGGGSSDDLRGTYEGEILNDFMGEQVMGLWTLTVEDHATRDTGTLNSWGIDLDCQEFLDDRTEIFIPEEAANDTLVSVQKCRLNGRVTVAEADVEIEHPLVGDLVVSLVSPAGKEVVLHNREGGSQNHFDKHFAGDILAPMKGESTAGDWTLKVHNFHSSGQGRLKHWKVKLNYELVDDLKIVEGIGPKIEQLLNNGGIWSFASLAITPAEQVKEILLAGGDRFKMHDPATWAHQATLAANGRWDELKVLQDELDGGKVAVAA